MSLKVELESVFFANDVENRSAKLEHLPEKVISFQSADLVESFQEGVDYEVNYEKGSIHLTDDSKVKSYNLLDDVLGERNFINKNNHDKPFFHGEADFMHSKQYLISYETIEKKEESIPWKKSCAEKYEKFRELLNDKKESHLLLLGDSISVGYNASGFVDAKPYQAAYGELIKEFLQKKFNTSISFKNISKAGAISKWALSQMDEIKKTHPDLAVVAFGMNDSGRENFIKVSDRYENNIKEIIEKLRLLNPKVEIVLVANMLSNNDFRPHEGHFENRRRLYKLSSQYENVAVADVMSRTEILLKRKKFADISGNNLNHPNDFLHREYAKVILCTLGID